MPQTPPAVEAGRDRDAESSEPSAEQFEFPARIVEDPIEAQRARDRDERAEQHDADDLQAQRDAATAAKRSADAAEWQGVTAAWQTGIAVLATVIAAVGTIAVICALKLARKANLIAHAGVRVAQDTAKRQLRAYVHVGAAKIDFHEDDLPIVRLVIKNFGQTPARDVAHASKWIVTKPEEDVFDLSDAPQIRQVDLAPGQPISPRKLLDEDGKWEASEVAILDGDLLFYFFGRITYKDVFGRGWHTDYRFELPIAGLGDDAHLAVCKDGNSST